MAAEYKGLYLGLHIDGTKALAELSGMKKGIDDTQKQLSLLKKELKLDFDNKKFDEALVLQSKHVSQLEKKLANLKKAKEQADSQGMDKSLQSYIALEREIKNTELALRKSHAAVKEWDNIRLDGVKKGFADADKSINGTIQNVELLKNKLKDGFDNKTFIDGQKGAERAVNKVRTELDAAQKELKKLESSGASSKEIEIYSDMVIKLKGNLQSTVNVQKQFEMVRLDNVKQGFADADKEIERTNKAVEILKNNLNLKWDSAAFKDTQGIAQRAVTGTRKELEAARTELKRLENEKLDKNITEIDVYRDRVQKLEKDLYGAELAQKSLAALPTERLGAKLNATGSMVTAAGQAAAPASAAAVAGLTLAAKAAMDYDQAFTGVRKTVEATEPELAKLSQDIRDLALEIPKSAVELANIAESAGQLGVETPNIKNFVEVIAKLETAAPKLGGDAAESIAKVMNVMQTAPEDVENYASTIVELGNKIATTEDKIQAMATVIAPSAKILNISESDVLGLSAGFDSLGISAVKGGGSISKIMQEIALQIQTNGKKLKDYAAVAGMSAAEFKQAFEKDAAGAFLSFTEGLGQQGEKAIGILDGMDISEIKVVQTMLAAAGSGDKMRTVLNLANQAWEDNTALTTEADKAYKSAVNQNKLMINSLNEAGISLSNILLPALVDGANKVKDFAKWLANLDEGSQKWLVTVLALIGAAAPLLLGIGKVISMIGGLTTALAAYETAMGTATAGTAALGVAQAAMPLGALTLAITTVAGVLINYAISANQAESSTFQLTKVLEDNAKAYEDAKNAANESADAEIAKLNAVEKLIPELETLSEKTDRAKEDDERLEFIVGQLNKAIPDLALAIDGETGALNRQIGTVYSLVTAYQNLARAKAMENILTAGYESEYKAQKIYDEQKDKTSQIPDTVTVPRVSFANIPLTSETINIENRDKIVANYNLGLAETELNKIKNENVKTSEDLAKLQSELPDELKNNGKDDNGKNTPSIITGGGGSSKKSGGGAGKAAKDADKAAKDADKADKEARDNEYKNLKYALDMGEITQRDYYARLTEYRDKYFSEGSEEWQKYTLEIKKGNEKLLEDEKKAFESHLKDEASASDKAHSIRKREIQLNAADEKEANDNLFYAEKEYLEGKRDAYFKILGEIERNELLSDDEKLKIHQEYYEKYLDTDLSFRELIKARDKEQREYEKRIADEAAKALDDEFRDMSSQVEIFFKQSKDARMQAYNAEKEALQNERRAVEESVRKRIELEKEALKAKIDAIDEEIKKRRELRADEDEADKLSRMKKEILATEAQINFARDADEKHSLEQELVRQLEAYSKEVQSQDDTLWERVQNAEKDRLNGLISAADDKYDSYLSEALSAVSSKQSKLALNERKQNLEMQDEYRGVMNSLQNQYYDNSTATSAVTNNYSTTVKLENIQPSAQMLANFVNKAQGK